MSQDNQKLKLLLGNPAGLNALEEYLSAWREEADKTFTAIARQTTLTNDSKDRDAALILHGKICCMDELLRHLKLLKTSTEGK